MIAGAENTTGAAPMDAAPVSYPTPSIPSALGLAAPGESRAVAPFVANGSERNEAHCTRRSA